MGATVLGFSGNCAQGTASATRFLWLGHCGASETAGFTTEANCENVCRQAGTFSRLGLRVTGNTRTVNSTFRFRKNGANGNLAVTITASTSGWFEDTSNSDTVADGDTYCLSNTTGAGGAQDQRLRASTVKFVASPSGTVSQYIYGMRNTVGFTFTQASTTRYGGPLGNQPSNSQPSTESDSQLKMKVAGVSSRLRAFVLSNARTTTTTLRTRKNTANGNQTLSIGAGVTGAFEDTTNSDTLAVDDLFNWAIVTGTGIEALTLLSVAHKFASDSTDWEMGLMGITSVGNGWTINVANYLPFFGDNGAATTTESNYQAKMPVKVRADKLRVKLATNNATNNVTCALRVNGSSSALSVSVTASTTGLFEDTTNSVVVEQGDMLTYLYDSPNSASVRVEQIVARMNTSVNAGVGEPGTYRGHALLIGQ